jgi:signal transduction histidine kinase
LANELKSWFQAQSAALCAATLYRAPNMLPDEQDVAQFLEVVLDHLGAEPQEQLAAVQSWALTTIGRDALTAGDWLTILRVLKEEIGNGLKAHFSPEDALRHWRLMDDLMTMAIIETAQLTSYLGQAELLAHTVELREKLERLEQSKSNFITVGAHELRTPLTILEGYANMLRAQTESDAQLSVMVSGLENGLLRMKDIIGDMIDVSLIDLQSFELSYQQVNLERLIQMVAQNLERHFVKRHISLELLPFDGSAPTYADPQKLVKAFEKVLLNALKYTPDGGQVMVTGGLVPDADQGSDIDGYVRIQIRDSGIGIAEENLERIFDKFSSISDVRLHSSSKTAYKGGGPGLGLPITRGIIEAHGGRIWADSDGFDETNLPGSTFYLELPVYLNPPVSVDGDL